MYMTWIVFIRDGSENKVSGKAEGDQFINFKKRYLLTVPHSNATKLTKQPEVTAPSPSLNSQK
jgi:hypothetical protein